MNHGSGMPSGPNRGRLFDPQGNAIFMGEDRTPPTIASEMLGILTKQGVPGEAIYLITRIMVVGWCKLRGVTKDQMLRDLNQDWADVGAQDTAEREI